MLTKTLLGLAVIVFLMSFTTADTSFVYQQNSIADIRVPVYDSSNAPADNTVACNLTIRYPNGTVLVNNLGMTDIGGGDYNYTLGVNQTSVVGEYTSAIACNDGSTNGFSTFSFEINPSGVRASDARTVAQSRGVWVLLGIAVLFFIGFIFANGLPVKSTMLLLAIIFLIAGFNVVFISMKNEAVSSDLVNLFDGLTVVSFYAYWFLGGMILIVWLFTFFNTYMLKKNEAAFRRAEGFHG